MTITWVILILFQKIIMAENIYHLESKRVENSVFFQEIGGENGPTDQRVNYSKK